MDEFQVFRTVLGVDGVLMKIRIFCLPFLENRFGRIPLRVITQLLVIGEEIDRIQPESVGSTVHPEPNHFRQFLTDLRVVPVEIGLFLEKTVHVVLATRFIEGPGLPSEQRKPVIRNRAIVFGIDPNVPILFRVGSILFRFFEPGMKIGRMIQDQIEHDPDSTAMAFLHQTIIIGQRPITRIDITVIAGIVSEIPLGRFEDRGEPYRVDAKPSSLTIIEVIKFFNHSIQVTDAVIVAVVKTSWVDLVKNGMFPPIRRLILYHCFNSGLKGLRRFRFGFCVRGVPSALLQHSKFLGHIRVSSGHWKISRTPRCS